MEIGFTTGRLDKVSLEEKLNFFVKLGCTAVEFSWLDYKRADLFRDMPVSIDLKTFTYRSMHAPVKIDGVPFFYQNDEMTNKILNDIQIFVEKYQIKSVVLHPDRIKDWDVLVNYDIPYAIENMDWKKNMGRTVDDLMKCFENLQAGLVVDVNHVMTNDKTLDLFDKLFSTFHNKLKHFHLSGFVEYHEPLYETKQTELIDLVKDKNLPVIIESVCEDLVNYKKEFEYISDYLNR